MNIEKFGKGIKGFGGVLAIVVAVLLTVTIVKQCHAGDLVQVPTVQR